MTLGHCFLFASHLFVESLPIHLLPRGTGLSQRLRATRYALCAFLFLTVTTSPLPQTVKPDMSNFDGGENSAWPYLLDEFVDHLRSKRA